MDARRNHVYVTGMGIISAMGIGVEQNYNQLCAEKSGIGQIRHLESKLSDELPAGEVKYTNKDLADIAGVRNIKGISRAAIMGIIAAKEALSGQKLQVNNIRTGIVSGTTAESMTNIELYLQDFLTNDSKNEFIESQDWGFSTEIIARETGIQGYQNTINTACSSSANAIMLGARMIRHGLLDRVLVGGTDALSKLMLNGFHALMIVDSNICKPFDQHRKGMNLGEGAAYLLIESGEIADKNNMICKLSGYGNSNDAYHLTALSPDGSGAAMAMQNALNSAHLLSGQIDYINTHGTGSVNNDLSEALGIKEVFQRMYPPFSSTKPYTGHTLGSAGALEAVFSILAMQNNLVFPTLNFKEKMEEVDLRPAEALSEGTILNHVLSNSFGFGGNNTSIIFSKASE